LFYDQDQANLWTVLPWPVGKEGKRFLFTPSFKKLIQFHGKSIYIVYFLLTLKMEDFWKVTGVFLVGGLFLSLADYLWGIFLSFVVGSFSLRGGIFDLFLLEVGGFLFCFCGGVFLFFCGGRVVGGGVTILVFPPSIWGGVFLFSYFYFLYFWGVFFFCVFIFFFLYFLPGNFFWIYGTWGEQLSFWCVLCSFLGVYLWGGGVRCCPLGVWGTFGGFFSGVSVFVRLFFFGGLWGFGAFLGGIGLELSLWVPLGGVFPPVGVVLFLLCGGGLFFFFFSYLFFHRLPISSFILFCVGVFCLWGWYLYWGGGSLLFVGLFPFLGWVVFCGGMVLGAPWAVSFCGVVGFLCSLVGGASIFFFFGGSFFWVGFLLVGVCWGFFMGPPFFWGRGVFSLWGVCGFFLFFWGRVWGVRLPLWGWFPFGGFFFLLFLVFCCGGRGSLLWLGGFFRGHLRS